MQRLALAIAAVLVSGGIVFAVPPAREAFIERFDVLPPSATILFGGELGPYDPAMC